MDILQKPGARDTLRALSAAARKDERYSQAWVTMEKL